MLLSGLSRTVVIRLLRHHLYGPCVGFFLASLILGGASFFPRNDRASGLMGNIAAGCFGTACTLIFVDRVVEEYQRRERQRYKEIALRSLGLPIRRHHAFLCSMLKASTAGTPDATASSLRDLFSAHYAESVRWLDFSKAAGTDPPITWAEEGFREFLEFKEALTRTLDKYALFLGPDLVTMIERLVTADLVGYSAHFRTLAAARAYPGFFADRRFSEFVHRYVEDFAALAEEFNAAESETRLQLAPPDQMWRTDVAPVVGSGRLTDLPA